MITYTITIKWNMMKVTEGKKKLARKVWYGPGIEFFVEGEMKGGLYGQAANLAMNVAEGHNIPARSLRSVNRAMQSRKDLSPSMNMEGLKTKKLF